MITKDKRRFAFWIGILSIVAIIGSANAQEKLPRQCEVGIGIYGEGECEFSYAAGDYVYIAGVGSGIFAKGYCYVGGGISAWAFAGTAGVNCSDYTFFDCDVMCEGWSTRPAAEDGVGLCAGYGGVGGGGILCRSVTPEEAATLKDLGPRQDR